MSRPLGLAILGLFCTAASAAAQSGRNPQLILSIGGGLAAGTGEIWSMPRQAVFVSAFVGNDTLALARRLRPGPTATFMATYHRSGNLGITGEAGYFGLSTEQRCASATGTFRPDGENKNQQACTAAQGSHVPTSVVGFQFGLAYRVREGRRLTPYVRASGGVGFLANPYLRTEGAIAASTTCAQQGGTCVWTLIEEEKTSTLTWIGSLAAGAMAQLGPGYRVRFEVRDLVAALPVPDGPANVNTGVTPVRTAVRHALVLTAGLDVVLERRRGRRY